MGDVTKLPTPHSNRKEQIAQVVAAVNQLSGELSTLVVFGKCEDGTFVTLTANTMSPEMLGYSYCQLNQASLYLAQMFENSATTLPISEE